ncbi:DUF6364 family protein [Sediminibacterium sp.]|uniref:DUF6364 family protein n=1 Tax=Sediminibacterium sp. TaxID=1917865 RepID=UPI0026BDB110|nr:DUF6364 family protein [Sediminibacterium sp.]MDP3392448.1 DUF6364 family protein [Sediminibacterium sp.]MDP3565714.1 DUF6364 family protein [Sediminibacterium sp.]
MGAKNKNTNLSKLTESYNAKENSPLVKSLSAIVKLPKNFDEKKEYRKHLVSKYGK